MAALNTSLRQLNASIGGYIDQLTRNRTPQEVLDPVPPDSKTRSWCWPITASRPATTCFTTAQRFWTGLDECDGPYAQALIQDYCRVERVTETEGEASVRQLVQRVRDELDIMRDLLARSTAAT